MGLLFHCSPNSPSVNSKQSHKCHERIGGEKFRRGADAGWLEQSLNPNSEIEMALDGGTGFQPVGGGERFGKNLPPL
jgi:hypothetical protein